MKEQLIIEHLSAYLPYGVKIDTPRGVHTLKGINTINETIGLMYWVGTLQETSFSIDCKPILRPLSDITKEIEHNGERLVPSKVIEDIALEWVVTSVNPYDLIKMMGYENVQKLLSWHFDIFGLIDQGLAIDINTLDK